MRPYVIAILALAGCVPQLTSPTPPDLTDWACPDNGWGCEVPPATLATPEGGFGFFPGNTLPRGALVDQHGNTVDPWQFYGRVVVVDVSTMWCSPCRQLACYVQHTADGYADDGVVYLTVLPQNTHGGPPSIDDLNTWADDFEITSPIVSDPDHGWSRAATPTNSFPALIVADRELRVTARVEVSGPADAVDIALRRQIELAGDIPRYDEPPKSVCER
jgi:thiol-disulfide isomerase/thioredoxin